MNDDLTNEKAAQLNRDERSGTGTGGVEELHKSIHESAQTIRSLMLFVLIVAAYVLIVVGLTTDMMLVREEDIILPFIQVGVPVVAFYVVAPLLLLFLHFNLLARLVLLARDIYASFDSDDDGPTTTKAYGLYDATLTMLFPIDPVRLMLDMRKATFERAIFSIVFFIQVGTIPMIVLLFLQARFLAYQDEWITLFHQIFVTIDLLFQLLFMLSYNRLWRGGKKYLRPFSYLMGPVFIAIPAFFVWTIALVPNSYIENKVESNLQQSLAGCFFPDWWKNPEDQLFPCAFIKGERFIDVRSEVITLRNVPPSVLGDLIQIKEDSALEILCEHVGELNLNDRRFHYANFRHSRFKCAEMERTQLYGANMVGARLDGINLQAAGLRSADLRNAELNGANLRDAVLKNADLRDAELNGANLRDADLRGADLSKARLHGADLSKARLHGADLYRAQLHGATLTGAQLYAADLSWAELHGTSLDWAELLGADLYGTQLYGADLSWAQLHGANLHEAELYDTKLSNTELYSANLSRTDLRDVDLRLVDGKIPNETRWNQMMENIRQGLREAGHSENKIATRLVEIERNGASALGFVLPPPPPAVNCVYHPNTPPFADWEVSEKCAKDTKRQ